jgi:hypothetical protein
MQLPAAPSRHSPETARLPSRFDHRGHRFRPETVMRFFALLTLSAVLTGCCQTRPAERCCGPLPGCKTDCPPKLACTKPSNPCGMPSKCCDSSQGYRCRTSFKVEWKPVKYPSLKMVKTQVPCSRPQSRCISDCRPRCTQRGDMIHGNPFHDTPILESPSIVDPQPQSNEAAIPGVAPMAQRNAPQVPEPANDASAAYNRQYWNSQTGVPEVQDTPPLNRTASRDFQAYQDQRFAIEMWPHSPQYTGRR